MSRKKKQKKKREVPLGEGRSVARTLGFGVLGAALGLVVGYFVFLNGAKLSTAETTGYVSGSLIGGAVAGAFVGKRKRG